MDLLVPSTRADVAFQQLLIGPHAAQMQAGEPLIDPDEALERYNRNNRENHRQLFPLSDNLYALIFIVLADLSENQRERLTSTLTLRGYDVQTYSFEIVRDLFMELFCAPKSSLDNPNLRTSGGNRAFCVLEQGELCDEYGYWAEDEETGEVGFLQEMEDVLWSTRTTNGLGPLATSKDGNCEHGAPKGNGKGNGAQGLQGI